MQTRFEIPGASAERRRTIGWNSVQRWEINKVLPSSRGSRLGSACKQARVLVRLDRQHAVFFRFRPEQFDHLSEFFRVRLCEVMAFREVFVQVIEFPNVLVQIVASAVIGHRFPPLRPDAPVSKHLKILRWLPGRQCLSIGCLAGKGVAHGNTLDGLLRNAFHCVRQIVTADLHDCRHNIGDVVELLSDLTVTRGIDAFWP